MRFIAVNNGIDREKTDTLEFAPSINIMSEWYAKDIMKTELEQLRKQLSAFENAEGWAQKFVKLIDRYADFTDLNPTSSTSLSAEWKCMSATRKGGNKLFSISGYTLIISADLKMN